MRQATKLPIAVFGLCLIACPVFACFPGDGPCEQQQQRYYQQELAIQRQQLQEQQREFQQQQQFQQQQLQQTQLQQWQRQSYQDGPLQQQYYNWNTPQQQQQDQQAIRSLLRLFSNLINSHAANWQQPDVALRRAGFGVVLDAAELPAQRGVAVISVRLGEIANRAGIVPGDIILAYGGEPINTPHELQAAVNATQPGETKSIEIRRDDHEVTVQASF